MNEKELPHGCGLAIEVVCVCLALGVSFRFDATVLPFRRGSLKSTTSQLVVIVYGTYQQRSSRGDRSIWERV